MYLDITRVNGYIEEKDSNKYLKNYLKNIMMFLMEL